MKKLSISMIVFIFYIFPQMIFADNTESASPYLTLVAGPYLQHFTQTSITIMWETNLPSSSIVEFGESTPLSQRVELNDMATIHEVHLTGLKPQHNYFYRVISRNNSGDDVVASDIFTFQTAVREESAFAFTVVGDNRTYPDRFKKISEKMWAERPNFVLHVGDVVTDGREKEQWLTEFLWPAQELMRRVPMYVAIGNHERNAHWFYDYLSYPQPENYYSFKFGNAEFFIIDSNEDFTLESKQVKWLENALKSSKAKWKFVAHHQPPYSSDENDYGDTYFEKSELGDLNIRQLVPLYEKYHVDIVWVGHIHSYERTWPVKGNKIDEKNGVIYIQTGGGGAPLENFAPTRSWFTAKVLSNWQYCLVIIHDGTLQMMAYDIDGKLYDYLELKK
ncbi:MAG TPA: metallophosphoesterase family protein [Bacteroidetes bacterium]|nr:metallophosphoesterase family protein [Bacteroidota bacterium]